MELKFIDGAIWAFFSLGILNDEACTAVVIQPVLHCFAVTCIVVLLLLCYAITLLHFYAVTLLRCYAVMLLRSVSPYNIDLNVLVLHYLYL